MQDASKVLNSTQKDILYHVKFLLHWAAFYQSGLVYGRANTQIDNLLHTHFWEIQSSQFICMHLGCRRKPNTLRKPTQAQKRPYKKKAQVGWNISGHFWIFPRVDHIRIGVLTHCEITVPLFFAFFFSLSNTQIWKSFFRSDEEF